MSTREKQLELITGLFCDLLRESNPNRLQVGLSDLFVQINPTTGEVSLFSDEDEPLGSCTIFSWAKGNDSDYQAVVAEALPILREAVAILEQRGWWQHNLFERPFSVELVSQDFETIEELLFLDDDLVKVTTPLLQGLNEDLDNFLADLLGDLK